MQNGLHRRLRSRPVSTWNFQAIQKSRESRGASGQRVSNSSRLPDKLPIHWNRFNAHWSMLISGQLETLLFKRCSSNCGFQSMVFNFFKVWTSESLRLKPVKVFKLSDVIWHSNISISRKTNQLTLRKDNHLADVNQSGGVTRAVN